MAIDKRVASVAQAVSGVQDGARVMVSGFGGAGFANLLILALRDLGPRDLTLIVNSATHPLSQTHTLIEAGLVRKVICTAARGRGAALSPFEQLYKEGRIELVTLPQGTFAECIRAAGAGIPAFYTRSGVGTDLARGKEIRTFNGHDHVLEEAIPADIALIRADLADRFGNLIFRHAQMNFGPAMATAATTTIAEVRDVQEHPIDPTQIQLPGLYVQRVVAVGQ
jgi:3-oxoacid CoA-transferase A subunit